MYERENWIIKKAECQRTDAFELWCWRRLLRNPWTARRSNQSILKEISPEYSLEGLMLKLKLQYFGHLMQRTDSLEKTLMLGKIEGGSLGDDRGWDRWMASSTRWRWVWVSSRSWWWTGKPGVLQSRGGKELDMTDRLTWSDLTVRGFSAVNEGEIDVFLECPCFFYDSADVDHLLSGSSAFSKSSLCIWSFSVHISPKPSLKDFEHNLTSMWNEHNYMVVWTIFGIDFLWDWNENQPFPVLWPLLSFPNLLAYWVHHLTTSSFRIWNSWNSITSTSFFHSDAS